MSPKKTYRLPICKACLPPAVMFMLAVITLALIFVPQAWAAQSGNDVGQNVGDLLRRYAGEIYGGIVAIVSLMFLWSRRYTELAVFLLAAVIVAWLVFIPDDIERVARSIGHEIFRRK